MYFSSQDFSSNNGIYKTFGKELFDAKSLQENRGIWIAGAAKLKTQMAAAHPTLVHKFIASLDRRQKLQRVYSQNIVGLENSSGIMTIKDEEEAKVFKGGVVALHGHIHILRCDQCCSKFRWEAEGEKLMLSGKTVPCPKCEGESQKRSLLFLVLREKQT